MPLTYPVMLLLRQKDDNSFAPKGKDETAPSWGG